MSAVLAKDESFAGAFREAVRQKSNESSWLQMLRRRSLERFESAGFPTVDQEEWKYTNVAPIAKAELNPIVTANELDITRESLASFAYEEARGSRLVFVNGIFREKLSDTSSLPGGVTAVSLDELANDDGLVRDVFAREAESAASGFIALNAALFTGGLLLTIPRDTSIAIPIHLLFIAEGHGAETPTISPRVIVDAGENCEATIIESFVGATESAYLTNSVVDFDLKSGARVRHYRVQGESNSGFHIGTTRAELGAQASYEITSINLGAALSRHDVKVTMDHEGAACAVDGLYMIEGAQHHDTHSLIDHRQPHCTSRQLYKGILDGKSRAVFNGKVFVRHGAQQTDAQQTNKNLLLSSEAQVDTKPQLEIYADDVKCTHGAAIGQLEDEELFYLESRGINPALAKNMLTYGFAEEVIEKIKIDSIKRELDEAVLNRLHSEFQIEA